MPEATVKGTATNTEGFSTMNSFVYLNGRIVRAERATVSVFDRGFMYGDGLFETMKAMDGRPLFLAEHIRRLVAGSRVLGFRRAEIKPLTDDLSSGAVERLLKKNRLTENDAYLRITVTRGAGTPGLDIPPTTTPTFVMVARPIDTAAIERRQRRGTTAALIQSPLSPMPGIKTINFLPNILARREALRRRAREGIFTAPDGAVTEGTSSNIFIVKDGRVITPPASTSMGSPSLPGITRQVVIGLARGLEIEPGEERVTEAMLMGADEAFLTNTIVGVEPLVKVDSGKIGDGRPGRITRLLQRAYLDAESRNRDV